MLNYRGRLRLTWTEEPGLRPERVGELEQTNLAVLRCVAAIETGVSSSLREEQPELYHELERLGARLDLLLELVGRMSEQSLEQLEPRSLIMALERMRFHPVPAEVEPGRAGTLRIFLHPAVPQPLALPGRLSALKPDSAGLIWAEFEPLPMSERLRDALEQHVFRHHRRMIAEQRARRR